MRHGDAMNFRFLEPRKCWQREISRNAETLANTAPVKILEEKLPQRHRGWKRFQSSAWRPFCERSRCDGVGSVAGGQADSFPYRYSRIR